MTIKEKLATLSVVAAIAFGTAGTWIAPTGIIDSSLLYLIAQLLIFAATVLGFGEVVTRISHLVKGPGKEAAKEVEEKTEEEK